MTSGIVRFKKGNQEVVYTTRHDGYPDGLGAEIIAFLRFEEVAESLSAAELGEHFATYKQEVLKNACCFYIHPEDLCYDYEYTVELSDGIWQLTDHTGNEPVEEWQDRGNPREDVPPLPYSSYLAGLIWDAEKARSAYAGLKALEAQITSDAATANRPATAALDEASGVFLTFLDSRGYRVDLTVKPYSGLWRSPLDSLITDASGIRRALLDRDVEDVEIETELQKLETAVESFISAVKDQGLGTHDESLWSIDGRTVTTQEMDEALDAGEPGMYGYNLNAFLNP